MAHLVYGRSPRPVGNVTQGPRRLYVSKTHKIPDGSSVDEGKRSDEAELDHADEHLSNRVTQQSSENSI
jgi:hypothetical protein